MTDPIAARLAAIGERLRLISASLAVVYDGIGVRQVMRAVSDVHGELAAVAGSLDAQAKGDAP